MAGGTTRTLSYDPLNRLDRYNPGTATRFVYDGLEAAAELDSAGAIQNRYVMGDGADEVLVDYAGSGTTTRKFLSTDERGSVISLTDSSGGLVGIDSYDEYGKPGASNTGRFQYTGQKWLSELGAYDYKARAYLPHLGIFAQTDPIGQAGNPNLYTYVHNDPINLFDPSGKIALVDNLGGAAFAVGVDVIIQLLTTGKVDTSTQGLERLGVDAAVGFATSGISGAANLYRFSGLTRTVANAAIAAAGGVAQTAANSRITGHPANASQYAGAAVLGAAFGAIGSLVADFRLGPAMLQNAQNGVYLVDSAGVAFLVEDSRFATTADIMGALAGSGAEVTVTVVDENGNKKTVTIKKR